MALQDYLTLVFHSGDREATQSTWERTCSRVMRQPGCKPGRRSADFRMEGSKPTHGKGNRVLHPEPLSEKSGVGSPAKAREGNRVLHTSEEVGIVYGSVRSLAGRVACRGKRAQPIGTAAIPVLGDLQE